jgi:hypothetical protein
MLNIELPYIHLLSKSDLFYNKNLSTKFKLEFDYKNNYQNVSNIRSSFFWSKKLSYDLSYLLIEFSSMSHIPVSIFYPKTAKLVYKKIKNIAI